MHIVDVNVLLYSVNQCAVHHAAARAWLDDALRGSGTVGFAWPVLLAFLRVSTHRAIFERPLSVDQALDISRSWLGQPPALVIEPTGRHLDILGGLLPEAGTSGNLVADAHLAALAIEHGAPIVSFDADFSRFPGLKWMRPGGGSVS